MQPKNLNHYALLGLVCLLAACGDLADDRLASVSSESVDQEARHRQAETEVSIEAEDMEEWLPSSYSLPADESSRLSSYNTAPYVAEPDSTSLCGDGVMEGFEECDDGAPNGDDGCVACRLTTAHTIYLEVSNIPDLAERLFVAVDGGALSEAIVQVAPVVPGLQAQYVHVPTGTGGPFRARVIAVEGVGLPIALAGGAVRDIDIPFGESIGHAVDLQPFAVEIASDTPVAIQAGERFRLKMTIADPADALAGQRWGRIWYAHEEFEDLSARRTSGFLRQSEVGFVDLTAELADWGPNEERTIYFQVGQPIEHFRFKQETPYIVSPSTAGGESLYSVVVDPLP